LEELGLSVDVAVEPADLTVWADARRLEQILTNLIGNALKFTSQGGLTLRAKLQVDLAMVTVEDTGIGMAPGEVARVFDKFYQAHRLAIGAARGTGLGLAITHKLVELQGGRIWAESEEGKGSRFHFTLPLRPARTPAELSVEPARRGHNNT
jgi:signal transduction histidine kinase